MNNDLISREALKKDIEENSIVLEGVQAIEVDCAKVLIDNAPTVEPLEKIGTICNENCGYTPKGEWITDERGYVCSECGALHSDDYPFCHMCGARMIKEAEDD